MAIPLNPTVQASQARQMRGQVPAIQGTAPANMNALLAMRNQAVPSITNRIEGKSPIIKEIDKLKYQEQMKENLRKQRFDAETARQRDALRFDRDIELEGLAQDYAMDLADYKNQQALSINKIKNDQAIKLQELADRKALERIVKQDEDSRARQEIAYENSLDVALKQRNFNAQVERDKIATASAYKKLDQIETDKRYSGIASASRPIMDNLNQWLDPEHPNSKQSYIERRRQQLLQPAVLNSVPPESVNLAWENQMKANGMVPNPKDAPKFGDTNYISIATQIFKNSQEGQEALEAIETEVGREAIQIGQTRVLAYNKAMDTIAKLGISMPKISGASVGSPVGSSSAPTLQKPFQIKDPKNLPSLGGGEGKEKTGEEGGLNYRRGLAGGLSGAIALEMATNPSSEKLSKSIQDEGGLIRKRNEATKGAGGGFTRKATSEYEKRKVKLMRNVAKKLNLAGIDDLTDNQIKNMSVSEMREKLEDGRRGLVRRYAGKISNKVTKSGVLKTLKVGGYASIPLAINELIKALTPEEKKEFIEDNTMLEEAMKEMSSEGSVNGITYRVLQP
jgi:hypothetical protein